MITGASVSNALALGASGTPNDRKAWIQVGHPDTAANSLGVLALNPLGGNVGIGETSPGEKLTVSGNISASGDICTGATTIVRTSGTQSIAGTKTFTGTNTFNNPIREYVYTVGYLGSASPAGQRDPLLVIHTMHLTLVMWDLLLLMEVVIFLLYILMELIGGWVNLIL